MKSLRRVLAFRYMLLITAVLVVLSFLVIIPIKSYTESRERENLEDQAELFARVFHGFLAGDLPVADMDPFLERLAADLPVRLTVIDAQGKVLGDSDFPAEEMENHAGRPEVAAALEGRVASARRESRTLGRGFIYAAAPIEVDGVIIGVARVAVEEKDVTPVVYRVWWIFLAAFGFLFLVIAAVSMWTERTVTAALASMVETAGDLASGDLERRVTDPGIEEFGLLARDFNAMAEEVRRRVGEATAERGKLKAVLENISAGIMVTDAEGRIIIINRAAEAILGVGAERALGRRVIEAVPSRELDAVVSRAAAGEGVDEWVELVYPSHKFLHVKADPVRGQDGRAVATVSAVEDVTELERLNRMRQDFVANVSHELRTPVATIRALTESLLDGAVDDRERADRFLRDLGRETARLSQLIEDLLTLSRLEAREALLQVERLDLLDLVRDRMDAKVKLAEKFGVTLEVGPGGQGVAVEADRGLLGTAIDNILDNAIKYNRAGGKVFVSVEVDDRSGSVEIKVSDTGIGIPEEELPRIFERFYRLDRARSRETGGTGLGLSIVKHIADLHGGTVEVKSVVGEGSTFAIRLPRRRQGD